MFFLFFLIYSQNLACNWVLTEKGYAKCVFALKFTDLQ